MSGLMNLEKARKLMEREDLDCILLNSYHHIFYASGFQCFDKLISTETEAYFIVPREKLPTYLIAPHANRFITIDFPTSAEKTIWYGSFYVKDGWVGERVDDASTALQKAIKELNLEKSKIGIEFDSLPTSYYNKLKKLFPNATLKDASHLLREMRLVKNEEEIRRLRKASEITEKAVKAIIENVEAGMSELDLETIFRCEVAKNYARAFYVQIGSGSRGAYGGGTYTTTKKIERGEIVRMDLSVEYKGYLSDICREFVLGKASDEVKKIYKTIFDAVNAAIECIRPGVKASELFNAAVKVPIEAGYKDFRRHHVGHGIGLEAHEAPILAPTNDMKLKPGMTLCIEAPYYIFTLGGFAPEEMVLVTEDGCELFTTPEEELIEI